MKTAILLKVQKILKQIGIVLKTNITNYTTNRLVDGVTNQFIKVKDIKGARYLIRVNGKLWPPFTRENENNNLCYLQQQKIETQVIINAHSYGFQICRRLSTKRITKLQAQLTTANSLDQIGRHIRKVHSVKGFNNSYDLPKTVLNTVKRVETKLNSVDNQHLSLITRLLTVLQSDMINHTASHNDLLPSSVYCSQQHVVLVDWEYSGINHRSFDLAFFSIKTKLTDQQEQRLINSYDPNDRFDTRQNVVLMKPIISFLLLQWYLLQPEKNCLQLQFLFENFHNHIITAFFTRPIKRHVRSEEEKLISKQMRYTHK